MLFCSAKLNCSLKKFTVTLIETCPSNSAMYRFVLKDVCYPENLKTHSLNMSLKTSEKHLLN